MRIIYPFERDSQKNGEPNCTDRFRVCRPTSEHAGVAFCMYPAHFTRLYVQRNHPLVTFILISNTTHDVVCRYLDCPNKISYIVSRGYCHRH